MRRLLTVVLILCAIAAPTLAANGAKPRRITVVQAPVLRGPQSPARAPAAALSSSAPPPSWLFPYGDAYSCRQACAETRYFCEAGQSPDECGATWGQCAAACSAPNLAPTAAPPL
jgi:hypothetical protein